MENHETEIRQDEGRREMIRKQKQRRGGREEEGNVIRAEEGDGGKREDAKHEWRII